MKEWFTIPELAEAKLPDLPGTVRGIRERALREGWQYATGKCRPAGRLGGGFEYHISLLPSPARSKLAFLNTTLEVPKGRKDERSRLLWARYEALPKAHKAICQQRLDLLVAVEKACAAGMSVTTAIAACLAGTDVSQRTYYTWRTLVEGVAPQDRLAALAPSFSAATNGVVSEFGACHPEAWDVLKSDYLRLERPGFSACYRRMVQAATKHGWSPIPSERSLRRRLDAEVPKSAQIAARQGTQAATRLFPSQTRSKSHLHAMQIVNTDGHKLDLFVWTPWNKEKPDRVILLGMQDVFSGKILSWRLCEAETWEAVRACVGDMVETCGIPEHIYMDNGRAFSSKKISGRSKGRHRFKTTKDEVAGLLVTLGIEPHFTKPYSGQSKPIERAWRDLAEEICKHPAVAGAYTGNRPDAKPENYMSHAVPLDDLQRHVAERIAEHNARSGRRSATAKGRSFDETFAVSMADPATIVRQATTAQRALWLLTAERVTARKPDGAIHFMQNRYWAPALNELIGQKLTIRFDPDKLHEPVKVYDPAGQFICDAECRENAGFDDLGKARTLEKARRQHVKARKKEAEAHQKYNALQLAAIHDSGKKTVETPTPIRPAVTRMVTGNLAHAEPVDAISVEEFEASFSRGLAHMTGDSAIIPFPMRNSSAGNSAARKTRTEK